MAADREMIPRRVRKVLDARDSILGAEADELQFLHALLAQVSLPYRAPPEGARDYRRENGRASMILTAGYLPGRPGEAPTLQGLPYGSRPRLLLIHACTEAVRLRSPVIPIADSMSAFMRDLGLGVTGGPSGTIASFREQTRRLAAATMTLQWWEDDDRAVSVHAPPFRRIDLWLPPDHRQRNLWPSVVELSREFFDSLISHALPLDPRAVRALQHSAVALDLYAWLGHRLPRVGDRGALIPWSALHQQFGSEYARLRRFRERIGDALRQVHAVYPAARIEIEDSGLRLRSSPAPIGSRRAPAKLRKPS